MNTRSFKWLSVAAVGIVLVSSTGFRSVAAAATCPDKCQDIGASGAEHKFSAQGANYKCYPALCHDDPGPGTCAQYHDVCTISFRDARRDLDDIEAIVAEGRLTEIEDILDSYGDAVQYNSARNAVQVFGCDRKVIAHLPVSLAVAEGLE